MMVAFDLRRVAFDAAEAPDDLLLAADIPLTGGDAAGGDGRGWLLGLPGNG